MFARIFARIFDRRLPDLSCILGQHWLANPGLPDLVHGCVVGGRRGCTRHDPGSKAIVKRVPQRACDEQQVNSSLRAYHDIIVGLGIPNS